MIKYGKKAKMAFLDGIKEASEVVTPTLGPYYSSFINGNNQALLTNNGYRILEFVETNNPVSQLGVKFLLDGGKQLFNKYYNGTTSYILISSKMMEVSQRYLNSGIDEIKLEKAVLELLNQGINYLKETSIKINDNMYLDLTQVTSSDSRISEIVSNAYLQYGNTDYEILIGDKLDYFFNRELNLDSGVISSFMLGNNEELTLDNPELIIINGRVDYSKLSNLDNSVLFFSNLDNNEISNIIRHNQNCNDRFIAINVTTQDISKIKAIGEFSVVDGNYIISSGKVVINNLNTTITSSSDNYGKLTIMINDDSKKLFIQDQINASLIALLNASNGINLGGGIAYLRMIDNLKQNNVYEEVAFEIISCGLKEIYNNILYNASVEIDDELKPFDFNLNRFVTDSEYNIYEPTNLLIDIFKESINTLINYLNLRGFII